MEKQGILPKVTTLEKSSKLRQEKDKVEEAFSNLVRDFPIPKTRKKK